MSDLTPIDPYDLPDRPDVGRNVPPVRHDRWRIFNATLRQRIAMRDMGYRGSFDGMSAGEADNWIKDRKGKR